MGNHEALIPLGRALHQDVDLVADSPKDLALHLLQSMQPEERERLRLYLEYALDRYSPSELKGHLNRVSSELTFTSKGAARFLHVLAEQLRTGV